MTNKAPDVLWVDPETRENGPWTPTWKAYGAPDAYLLPYRRETECVWRSEYGWYLPQCDATVGSAFKPGDYCTYCGGRIRVEKQNEV